jgi:DNA-binding GntR family transcriptional regulator
MVVAELGLETNVISLSETMLSRPLPLSSRVAQRLRLAIVERELEFGEPLIVDLIAEVLGVSRTPVRDAIKMLEFEGLVKSFPQRGTFVLVPSKDDIVQLSSFRLILESQCVNLALRREPGQTIEIMKSADAEMEEAAARGDMRAFARADAEFHGALSQHCGNTYLQDAVKRISGHVSALRAHVAMSDESVRLEGYEEHKAIIQFAQSGKIDRLTTLLAQHIRRTEKSCLAAVAAGTLRSTSAGYRTAEMLRTKLGPRCDKAMGCFPAG